MGKLLPFVFLVVGLGAGAGTAFVLSPKKSTDEAHEESADAEHAKEGTEKKSGSNDKKKSNDHDDETPEGTFEYVDINNQFVVPLVRKERVSGLVVLSLSVEVPSGRTDEIVSKEPKLRDAMLSVLFDHASIGGFDGAFANTNNLSVLRTALRESAALIAGSAVHDILILDIARQDS